jgi:hypothetical protein
MSYPRNHFKVARRNPQHGVVIACTSSPPNPTVNPSSPQKSALTIPCAKRSCGNLVTIVPFGYHDGVDVHVNVECGDCYVSVVVEVEKKNSTEWVGSEGASVDGEEW